MITPPPVKIPINNFKPPTSVPNLGNKHQLLPTPAQKEFLEGTFAAVRRVQNLLIVENTNLYTDHKNDPTKPKPSTSKKALSKRLTALKREPEYEWLRKYGSTALQEAVLRMKGMITQAATSITWQRSRLRITQFHLVLYA